MNLISFAYDFVSYLLFYIDKKDIRRIFLFGSVVRGEAGKDSDVDIFVETDLDLQDKINKILDDFYKSVKYTKYWKPLNVKNQIKIINGKLEDFPDLERTLISNGVILYSIYEENIKGKNYSLFVVEFKGEFKDKMRMWRKLYGSKQVRNKKIYTKKGVIEAYYGRKIAKGVFIIPIENSNDVIKELRKLRVKYRVFDLSSDTL